MVLKLCLIISVIMAAGLTKIDLNPFEIFQITYLSHFLKENVAPMHRKWNTELHDRSTQYLCLEAGRSSAKTTIGSVAFSLYNICESEDEEMQVASRSAGVTGTSTKIMARVKRELEENEVLIHDYGIKQGSAWGSEHIQVLRGDGHRIDFYSVGKRSSIRGSRGTVVIDDPQNIDDCRSETVLERDLDWFLEDVVPIIIGDQRLIFIGTVMSPLSLLAKVKQMSEFKVLSFPAEDPIWSGRSAWPEQWSDEFLAQRKNMLGMERYGSEYLCIARVPGNPVFQSEWFPNYEPNTVQFRDNIAHQITYRVTGFDGAESKDSRADYTAIVTLGMTYGKVPDIYVLDVQRERLTTKEGVERLFIVFDNQKQNKTIVESRCKAPNKDAIVEEIEDRQRVYGKHVNMYQVKPLRDKVTRAHAVQSICQEGRVYINRHDSAHQLLLEELTMFTGDQNFHDDLVDAFVMALTDVKQHGQSQGIVVKSALQGVWA